MTMRARVMVCVWKGLMVVVCERGDIVTACVGEDVIVSLCVCVMGRAQAWSSSAS